MKKSSGMKNTVMIPLVLWALMLTMPTLAQTEYDRLLDSLTYEAQVRDDAGVLSEEERTQLEQKLGDYRESTGNELAVVLLPSLQGGQIDDFGNKLFEKWKLGEADKDNGLLLLVAVNDRKMRIEVGYGLEAVLPDAACGRIRDQFLAPAFREGQYARGVNEAVDAFIMALNGEAQVEAATEGAVQTEAQPISGTAKLLILLFFAVLVIVLFILGKKGRLGSGNSTGGGGFSSGGGSGTGSSSGFSGGGGGSSGGGGASGSW